VTAGPVAGVVLAAGRSRRLGRPKQLLDLGGKPLLRRTLDNALASSLDRVVVVLGHDADAVAAALGDQPAAVVVNPAYADGQATSVAAGVGALGADTAAALLLLGDQPGVTPAVIDAVLAAWRADPRPIAVPLYGGTPGNPVLFRRDLFPDLLRLAGDEGARSIVRSRAGEALRVAVPLAAPPPDVDTDDDYRRLLAAWRSDREAAGASGSPSENASVAAASARRHPEPVEEPRRPGDDEERDPSTGSG
jgi:molybdenum cofactor cytidylyltransferase